MALIELFQAEWCPHSHTVRARMTEKGIDFIARQVPAEPEDREELMELSGSNEIPVAVVEDGSVISGEDAILDYLERSHEDEPDAGEHRRKVDEKASFG
jgi:glutathione S-transferase